MTLATLILAALISQLSLESPTASQKKAAVAHSRAGTRALKSRQHINAINHFTESLESWERAEIYVGRAATWIKLHKFDLAIEDCERAIEMKPKLALAYYFLCLAQNRSNDPTNALHALKAGEELVEGKREHWKFLHQQAVAHAALGEFVQATKLQRRVMDLAPVERLPLMLEYLEEFKKREAATTSESVSDKGL